MSRSTSAASAAASSAGVSYFENSCLDAISVISSRVRWDKIVEIRTLNGSSVSATIFANAVSPEWRSPSGRYRRERSRTINRMRSRADAEVVKGLPRRVNRTRDQDEVVDARLPDRDIDRVADRSDGVGFREGAEGGGDFLRVVRAMGLRPAGEHTGCDRPQGRRHAPEVLVVQDAGDQDGLATGERLRHRRGQRDRSGAVVGSIDDDERGLAYDFHPGRPPNGRNPGADRLVWKRKPGRAELLKGGNRDAQVLHLERAEERRLNIDRSEGPAHPHRLTAEVAGRPLRVDVPSEDRERYMEFAASRFDDRERFF